MKQKSRHKEQFDFFPYQDAGTWWVGTHLKWNMTLSSLLLEKIFITERKFPDADKKRLWKKKFKFIFRTKLRSKIEEEVSMAFSYKQNQ